MAVAAVSAFPMKAGGGLMALLVAAAALLLPKLLGGGTQSLAGSDVGPEVPAATEETCQTELEQILCGGANDVSEYWIRTFPTAFNSEYQEAPTVFFSGATNTGCGQASAQMGPFYCPADGLVYFDLDFLTQLQNQFGATGDLAAQYIVAHEYGHHVQNVLGISAKVHQLEQQDPANANRYSVALELQADCLAGAWARDADERSQLDAGRDQRGAQRGVSGRRRRHPAAGGPAGEPGQLHPRVVGAASAVVPAGLRHR